MNDNEKKELATMIQTLFHTRNQLATNETLASWGTFLRDYNIIRLREVFTRYIKYGDTFPSLPSIIALIENRVDSDTASIDAWASVRKAMKASSSKSLTPAEKEVLNRVSTGLTACMEASTFDLSQIERDFKKMYKAGYEGISRELFIEPNGAVQIANKPETKSIENGGLFENK